MISTTTRKKTKAAAKVTKKNFARPLPKKPPARHRPEPRVALKPVGHIAILTDASGSMESKVPETIAAFNGYLNETAKAMKGKPVTLQVYQFSGATNPWGTLRVVHTGRLDDGFRLSSENYNCGGGTPLIDACCDVIDQAKADWSVRKIVCIQTDGEENQSKRFNKDDLKQRIAQAEAVGWQIIFLGTGIDAFAEAQKYDKTTIYNTVSVPPQNLQMFGAMNASKSADYFTRGQTIAYSTKDRVALGEASLTGAAASLAAGAVADALEVEVKVTKKSKKQKPEVENG